MSKYKIVVGVNDNWDLVDERGNMVIFWGRRSQCMYVMNIAPKESHHMYGKPATEAHGLLILNALKAQLEAEDDSE